MSDRASRHPGRTRLAARAALLLAVLGLVAGPVAPLVAAATGLSVTTPFPSIVAEPGSTASFKVTLDSNQDGEVKLAAAGVPTGWTARFTGGSLVVAGAYVTRGSPVDVTLNVDIPKDAAPATSTFRVEATGPQGTTSLPLTVRIEEKVGGDVTLTSDYPELRGSATSTFSFNLTLRNGTATESTFAVAATGPDGWTITAKPSSQAQATSTVVAAGSTASITVTATPPRDIDAGTADINVTATGADRTATADLKVTVTGSYSIEVSTPSSVLSTTANAGATTDFALTFTNTGTAPLTQVKPTAGAPTGWTVEFDQESVPTIAPGESATVTAKITPTTDAITGDYNVTMTASADEASGNVTIRVKVDTPAFWWIAGLVLIAAVFVGLWWVFRTYGRR
jgi:uncharacterized membrane protein